MPAAIKSPWNPVTDMAEQKPIITLDETLKNAKNNDEQSIRAVLRAFVQSKIFVLLDQKWDGKSFPRSDMRFLLVSDGDNTERAMIAVFTSAEHCKVYGQQATPFVHAVEVDSAWACLGVPADGGIMINPNSAPNFRIGPEVASVLRDTAEKDVAAKITPRAAQ